MTYCSLQEAWGKNEMNSRVKNAKGTQNKISYEIKNKNKESFSNVSSPLNTFSQNDCSFSYLDNNNTNCENVKTSFTNESILIDKNNNNTKPQLPNNTELNGLNNCDYNYSFINDTIEDECNIQNTTNYLDISSLDNTQSDNLIYSENENINSASNKSVKFNNNITEYNMEVREEDVLDEANVLDEDNIKGESISSEPIIEGFDNDTSNTKLLELINKRLDALENKINRTKNNNNIHDIILFIIIGIFILFALDSIFKIGRMTV